MAPPHPRHRSRWPLSPQWCFLCNAKTPLKSLAELFRARLLRLLVKEGVIDDSFVAMLMKWKHTSGFNADNSVHIARGNEKGITALAQYIIRNPFSLDKLSYNQDTGMVVYRSEMTHGKNKKNFSISTADEFTADITQHIPEKSIQLVRYYGWYSNRMRGERRKLEEEICGGNAPQGHFFQDILKRCGRWIR